MTLIEQLKLHEGIRYTPYKCSAGKLTIGAGRNLEDNALTSEEKRKLLLNRPTLDFNKYPLDDGEVNYLLLHDIEASERQLSRYSWYSELSQDRQNAMIDMIFNLGPGGFSLFKKMIFAMAKHDYPTARIEMLNSKWARQVGRRSRTLANLVYKI